MGVDKMIEQIEVNINDEVFKYSKGITLQEIYMEHQEKHQYPIILARVNNRQKELSFQLKENSKDLTLKFFTCIYSIRKDLFILDK